MYMTKEEGAARSPYLFSYGDKADMPPLSLSENAAVGSCGGAGTERSGANAGRKVEPTLEEVALRLNR